MEKKIITICPTRERPAMLLRMLDSFYGSIANDQIVVLGIDSDDFYLSMGNYKAVEKHFPRIIIRIFHQKTVTQIFNLIFEEFNDYQIYHMTNDDFVYKTKFWDQKIVQMVDEYGSGIYYGNDFLQKDRLCTAPFITGDLCRAIGWLQMPLLIHLGGDCVWFEIGKRLKRLFYREDIVIEHMHYQANKSIKDKIYEKTNSNQMYHLDHEAYKQWYRDMLDLDIDKINKICKL